jgi:hypothetical protein
MDAVCSRLRIGRRFRGPPGAANGGFASGSLATLLGGAVDVEVSLRRSVPLERPLEVRHDGDAALLLDDDGWLLAEARPPAAEVELTVPDTPTPEEARAAAGRGAYYGDPLFPDCFVCGPARASGDGLRIFPGPVSRRSVWAAPWTPDPSVGGPDDQVRDEVVWAALDCPGGVAAVEAAAVPAGTPVLLGQMTARLGDRTVRVAAELADGWFPLFVARDQVLDRVHTLRKDREAAALRTEPLTVAGPMTIATDDAAVARRISASCVAWYLSAMGDVYARFVTEQGYGSAVQVILEANPHPRPDGGVVPAEAQVILDQFTAHGTPSQVRDQLAGWSGAVDVAMIGLPPGLPWVTIEATLRAAAPGGPSGRPAR